MATNPTDLRARAKALLDVAGRLREYAIIADSWRESGTDGADDYVNHTLEMTPDIVDESTALIRDLLAALPPDPTPPGERRPCEGWREGVSASELFVGTFLRLRAGAIAWEVEVVKTSGLARWCDTLKSGIVTGGPVAAKLAAEDAADALLLAGRRALGRV